MTILLVDDERDILEGMLAGIDFQSLGIEQVFTAESVAEAKTILREEQVDLLLTDIEMPRERIGAFGMAAPAGHAGCHHVLYKLRQF